MCLYIHLHTCIHICLHYIVVFGAILSATDTVAVLGLLKNAGASAKLTYFIAGESLLNDGTALAMYNLLFRMIKINTTAYTSVEIVEYILKVIFLSPIIGICFGLGCLTLVSYFNHRMVRLVLCCDTCLYICVRSIYQFLYLP